MKPTKESLEILQKISNNLEPESFHHHTHILFDIANTYSKEYKLNYLEIGCYAGLSACLMLQRENTNVTSIDLGWPISPEVVFSNIRKHNHFNNNYIYVQGNSTHIDTISKVSDKKFDIIFIDGDHNYFGVWTDYINYSKLLADNGYIVFDDYNDFANSPHVKSAVDHIVNQLNDEFEIIGTFKNIFGARGYTNENKDGNCFVIKKRDKKCRLPIAVCISTYYKSDMFIDKFAKTLESVFNQTYSDFKVFITGDNYSEENKLIDVLNRFPKDKIIYKNLKVATERQYHPTKEFIWMYGGVNAFNRCIDMAIDNGYDYIAHLDHDDIWYNNHLQELATGIEITGADFICTRGIQTNFAHLPILLPTEEKYVKFYPIYNGILHSTVCINFNKIPLRYEDLFLTTNEVNKETSLAGDSYMWERCRKYIIKNGLRSFCVNTLTMTHETENT